jgi:hypothetical protein
MSRPAKASSPITYAQQKEELGSWPSDVDFFPMWARTASPVDLRICHFSPAHLWLVSLTEPDLAVDHGANRTWYASSSPPILRIPV